MIDVENAHMVPTAHGFTPEPAMKQSWSALTKLQWSAALIRNGVGLNVTVNEGNYSRNGVAQPGYYSVNLRYGNASSSSGPHNYEDAWTYLNGIRAGYEAALSRCCNGGPQWGHAWDCRTLEGT